MGATEIGRGEILGDGFIVRPKREYASGDQRCGFRAESELAFGGMIEQRLDGKRVDGSETGLMIAIPEEEREHALKPGERRGPPMNQRGEKGIEEKQMHLEAVGAHKKDEPKSKPAKAKAKTKAPAKTKAAK